jgi:mannosyltransferase OCH1-like enzyme
VTLICIYTHINYSENFSIKPIIWMYWEGDNMPPYIHLCIRTIHKHCDANFDVKLLDDKTVHEYIPNLRTDINKLQIAQKSDYIRVYLLYLYGGIWLDVDTIVFKDLSCIIDKLKQYEFIGFGCSKITCYNGYDRPSNQAMASIPKSKIITASLNRLNKMLDNQTDFKYFDLGKYVLWHVIKKNNLKYYHYNSKYDGSRDINGMWITPHDHLSNQYITFMSEKDMLFMFLTNNMYNTHYKWFIEMNETAILKSNMLISNMLRKALT